MLGKSKLTVSVENPAVNKYDFPSGSRIWTLGVRSTVAGLEKATRELAKNTFRANKKTLY